MRQVATGNGSGVDLCLILPPFDSISFPSLGVSVLVAACRARGLSVKVVYASLALASRIGADAYRNICTASRRDMPAERLFVPFAYPAGHGPTKRSSYAANGEFAKEIAETLFEVVDEVLAARPRIVGLATMFVQNLSAASVARAIKEAAPEICVVLGGANVASPMGGGLMKVFPFIDYFFSGEADTAFPDFCERLIRENKAPEEKLVECAPIDDMRVVFAPDYSDYFAALRDYQRRGLLPANLPNFLLLEASRGCWWGEKHHCTFCGLNGNGMEFRKKPADRVLAEMRQLKEDWGTEEIHFADNIMPLNFIGDLFPELARWEKHPRLFFEVKANLRDDQLDVMRAGGVTAIQPGIESLSTHVLKLMRKGVSALHNIALLRSSRARAVGVLWNYIYGFPGETAEDYRSVLGLIPQLEHLNPPYGVSLVVIDRYSPFHREPELLGIGETVPFAVYGEIYPDGAPISDIAYHFDGRYTTPLLSDAKLLQEFEAALARWKSAWTNKARPPVLRAVDIGKESIAIADTRSVAKDAMTVISREAAAALRYLERPRPQGALPANVEAHVENLLRRHFVIAHEDCLMSVVTRTEALEAEAVPHRTVRQTPAEFSAALEPA
jgi:ribosomal peptide maturation radical SAM protein 1